jgi:hypothetical protein
MGFGLNIAHNRAVPLPAREAQTNAATAAARRVEWMRWAFADP